MLFSSLLIKCDIGKYFVIQDILQMRNISKSFPGVKALDDVNFTLKAGEIHAIVGQNGAGKSTLMKILAGNYQKNNGEIFINGKNVEIHNPREAAQNGIALVHQELSLAKFRTVAENIFLGREPKTRAGLVSRTKMNQDAKKLLSRLEETKIFPEQKIQDLTVAQQQIVEISKALSISPSIYILDEPTSSLTLRETENLFTILRSLKKEGLGIIFITHRLKEIFQCCDRITVLRDGKAIDTLSIDESDEQTVVNLMIGQNLANYFIKEKAAKRYKEVILSVDKLTIPGRLDAVAFKLHKGETLGITGLLGSGHDLVPRCIFGLEKTDIVLKKKGQFLKTKSPRDTLKAGLGLVTENRQEEGLFLKMSVLKNATILDLERVSTTFLQWIRRDKENRLGKRYIELMNVKTPSANQIIRNLSGGNQQKVIMARWLMRNSDILMFIEPTRGIDVGAKKEIYHYLHKIAREEGKGIIVVSTELSEVIGISDRILAMYNGRIVEDIPWQKATEEYVMKRITGG